MKEEIISIETLKEFEKSRVDKLKEPSKNLFYAIMKIADERDKYKIVLDKTKEYCKEVIKEHNNGEYNVSTTQLAIQEHKDNIENILELLEEIE